MGIPLLIGITVVLAPSLTYYFFVAPRLWMNKYGNGNYHGDRKHGAGWFNRQYKQNRLLESYGENPTGKDRT
jgi:hypothetical protein